MKKVLIAVIVCGVAVAQTKSGSTGKSDATSKAGAKAATPAAPKTAAAKPNLLDPNSMKAQAPADFRVKFTTTKGDFVIEVTRAWAPRGADRFYNLVRGGFFTDASFFRVLPRFVVQFGISARPDVAKTWSRANIADDPVTQSNKRGYVVFATAGPNTRTTQLFINYEDNTQLDSQGFAPFGRVVEGMDEVVAKIYSGYGEQPDQGQLESRGKAYVDRSFPNLDRILTATIVPATAPAPAAAKPAAK
jgi:peptidyl-prolyl cis-trans isomerase A (cyclophilin A)